MDETTFTNYLLGGFSILSLAVTFLFYRLERSKAAALAWQVDQTTYERDQKHELIEQLRDCKDKTLRIISVAKHPKIPKGVSDDIDRIVSE